MIKFWKRAFRKLTPLQVAAEELNDAMLSKLQAESGREYAQAMVTYHTTRVNRLRTFIAAETQQQATEDMRSDGG